MTDLQQEIDKATSELRRWESRSLSRSTPWALSIFGTGLVLIPDLTTVVAAVVGQRQPRTAAEP